MTNNEYLKVMLFLTSIYDVELNDAKIQAYKDCLIECDFTLIYEACKKYAKDTVSPKFPTPGAIIDAAKKLRALNEMTDIEAFGMLKRLISKYGQNRKEDALNEMPALLAKTVQEMGWREICMSTPEKLPDWFFRSYCTLRNRERELMDMSQQTRDLLKEFEFKQLETKKS